MTALDETGLDLLFRSARTFTGWRDEPLDPAVLEKLYDVARWGPTSINSCPARFVFLVTEAAKLRLKPHLDPGNVDKTMSAPCCVIVAYDHQFYDQMPKLLPFADVKAYFQANPEMAAANATRNSTLQGAYLLLAARALGLDCGPMQGFNREGVDGEFFPDGQWTANFLINLGHGDATTLRPRMPRLDFDEACLTL